MDRPQMSRAVLITGCSTGIGRATAVHLAGEVEAPVEEVPPEELRREVETNLFGPTRLTQMVLPGMRAQRWGRVANVSSVGGRITVPGGGAYHVSKHALEALSDALRFEVRGFGVDVVLVEPGAIRSRRVDTAVEGLHGRRRPEGPYTEFEDAVADRLRGAHQGVLALASAGPEKVAVVERAITAERPRHRYPVPAAAQLFIAGRWLPSRAWDAAMRRILPSPRAGAGGRPRAGGGSPCAD